MRALWMTSVLLLVGNLAHASPITYEFIQTSTTAPNFFATATITTTDGDLSPFPTLFCPAVSCPTDVAGFAPLVALSVTVTPYFDFDNMRTWTLLDFVSRFEIFGSVFPQYFFSPTGFGFFHFSDSFQLGFGLERGSISFQTDAPAPPCNIGGRCVSTGFWREAPTAIPEPSTIALVALGLLGVGRRCFKKRRIDLASRGVYTSPTPHRRALR